MIKFINLKSGKLYTGTLAYLKDKKGKDIIDLDKSYIHWFDEAQSVNLFYTKYLCFVADTETVQVSLPEESIFKILDPSKFEYNDNPETDETINNIHYKKIDKLYAANNTLELKPAKIDNTNVYTLYLSAYSEDEGEFIDKLTINDNIFLIGADFYLDNEILKVNMNNYNINIPDQIQKALYPSNIREDKRDNILMNRKWKELLSNYWDIIANKGSYKSLINSLNWFEYGDLVQLKEYWKNTDKNNTIYNSKPIQSVMTDLYENYLTTQSKTTYIGLYAALQEINQSKGYDSEKNPILKNVLTDTVGSICLDDLYLKMSLLGIFYETYFMPIHLDLIHSTIENVVFTNTIKHLSAAYISRNDTVCNYGYVKSTVDDGDIFYIGKNDQNIQVGPNTLFGTQYTNEKSYDDIFRVGVDSIVNTLKDNDLKTFWSQNYNGPGVLVPITVTISVPDEKDFINYEQLSMIPDNGKEWVTHISYKIFKSNSYFNILTGMFEINIKFNILCTEEREYELRLMFKTGSSKMFNKNIKFNVVCIDNASIDIYKVKSGSPVNNQLPATKYLFSRNNSIDKNKYYTQYVPAKDDETGIQLNNILVLNGDVSTNKYLNTNYYVTLRANAKYTVCVSKEFYFKPDTDEISKFSIYRNDYGYFPQFHHLEPVGDKKTLESYTITNVDTLCLVPNFSFGHLIDQESIEWVFENVSTGKKIELPSIQTPYVANDEELLLPNGYYNIIFRYKFIKDPDKNYKTLKINSAFLKKSN